jgi:hypothetical protein
VKALVALFSAIVTLGVLPEGADLRRFDDPEW